MQHLNRISVTYEQNYTAAKTTEFCVPIIIKLNQDLF